MHEGLQRGFGLLLRNAGLHAAEGVHPAIAALRQHVYRIANVNLRLHHDGNEDFRGETQFDAVKASLGDADDGHFVIIDGQRFVHNLRIAPKTRLPKAVIENNEGMAAGSNIVRWSEKAPHGGDNAESGEVGARDQFDGKPPQLPRKAKAPAICKTAKTYGKNFTCLPKTPH